MLVHHFKFLFNMALEAFKIVLSQQSPNHDFVVARSSYLAAAFPLHSTREVV